MFEVVFEVDDAQWRLLETILDDPYNETDIEGVGQEVANLNLGCHSFDKNILKNMRLTTKKQHNST